MSSCQSSPGRSTLKSLGRRPRGSCVRRRITLGWGITLSTYLPFTACPSLGVTQAVTIPYPSDGLSWATSTIARSTSPAGGRSAASGAAASRSGRSLTADLQHARHRRRLVTDGDQLARPGDALAHSQPRNASPRSPTRKPRDPEHARARGSCDAAPSRRCAPPCPAAPPGHLPTAHPSTCSTASRRSRAPVRPPSPTGHHASRRARSGSSAARSRPDTSWSRSTSSPSVERPLLSGPRGSIPQSVP
jgi:hypothetical protein